MHKLKITKQEWMLIGSVFLLAFIFTSRRWILFLDSISLTAGFLLYYIIIFIVITILTKFNLIGGAHFHIKHPLQILGLLLITFSFFIIFNWSNPYIQYITKGELDGVSTVMYQSEDGVAWDFWYNTISIKDINTAQFLAFKFTPALLTLIGCFLVRHPKLNLM